MESFDREAFNASILQQCQGKSYCLYTFDALHFMQFNSIVPNLTLFAQVSCRTDLEQLESTNLRGMAAACIGVFMLALYSSTINFEE